MPKIYVHTPFNLQHKGEKHFFPIGNHTVPADIADHWYTKAHTGSEPEVDVDTKAATDAMVADLEAREKSLLARSADLDAREGVLVDREKAVQAAEVALEAREKALAESMQVAQNAQSTAKDDGKPAAKANGSK